MPFAAWIDAICGLAEVWAADRVLLVTPGWAAIIVAQRTLGVVLMVAGLAILLTVLVSAWRKS